MAKQNLAFLYGRVAKAPAISKNRETGEYNYGMVYIDTVRGFRAVDDGLNYVKHEYPLLMSKEKEHIENFMGWVENDIVLIKGVVTSKKIKKSSFCDNPDCHDENGNPTKNTAYGNLIYITPLYLEKLRHCDSKEVAEEELLKHREVSNCAYVYGQLLKDPKLFTTKRGVKITQYPIAINRKYTIRTDDPSIRTDWPIVKSYGEQALDDKTYLHYQSEILVDGYLQARTVRRKTKCEKCGKIYEWKDHTMEIVPYATEYIKNFRTKEEVEEEQQKTVEEYKQTLFEQDVKDDMPEGLGSTDVQEN